MTEINETDLDYIKNLIDRINGYPDLDAAIFAAHQDVAMITKDVAIMFGIDPLIRSLKNAINAFESHHDRYEEYHKIFLDLNTIKEL